MSYIGIHITNINHTKWTIELQEILNLFIHFLHQFRTLNTSISLARLESEWEVCRFNSKTPPKKMVSKTHRTLKGLKMILSAFAGHEQICAFQNVFSHPKVVVYPSIYDIWSIPRATYGGNSNTRVSCIHLWCPSIFVFGETIEVWDHSPLWKLLLRRSFEIFRKDR